MTVQGGFGLDLQIDTGSGLTAVVKVLECDFPKFKKYLAESTAHDSTDGYYEASSTGKRRIEPFTATLGWDTGEATHAYVVTAFDSDDAVDMSIADPDGDETIAFAAHIEEIERVSEQEDIVKAKVLIHPTGEPTIT